jgi:hypothetical protein
MWWKLGALAVVTAGLLVLLLSPIPIPSVRVDLPPTTSAPAVPHVYKASQGTLWAVDAAFIAIVLTGAGFVARRIIRHHRNSN